jgi:hypothetical protein
VECSELDEAIEILFIACLAGRMHLYQFRTDQVLLLGDDLDSLLIILILSERHCMYLTRPFIPTHTQTQSNQPGSDEKTGVHSPGHQAIG